MIVERGLPAARRRLITIGDGAPLIDAAKFLRDLDTDLVGGQLRRAIGLRHHQNEYCSPNHRLSGNLAHGGGIDVMANAVACCHPTDLLRDVWPIMKERHPRSIPILDQDSRPIDVLKTGDTLEACLKRSIMRKIVFARVCDVRWPLLIEFGLYDRKDMRRERVMHRRGDRFEWMHASGRDFSDRGGKTILRIVRKPRIRPEPHLAAVELRETNNRNAYHVVSFVQVRAFAAMDAVQIEPMLGAP